MLPEACTSAPVPRQPEVVSAVDRLNALTSDLLTCIERLENRCELVMGGADQPTCKHSENAAVVAPLANQIHGLCDRLLIGLERLHMLHDRIEL